MEIKSLIEVVAYFVNLKEEKKIVMLDYAIEELQTLVIDMIFEQYNEKNYDSIKYAYEERLTDNGRYGGCDLSQIDDGRHEFCWTTFADEVGIKSDQTDDEQYSKCVLFYNK